MAKYIIELILATIIIFFVWNILKKIFFTTFYNNFPNFNSGNQKNTTSKSQQKNINEKVNWDAETVDYEEVKDENKSN